MYVTVIQNISVPIRSVSSLSDCLKHLNSHQIDLFFSKNLAITCYSTLYEKQTLFICIYIYKIDTGPITYPIDAHQRWTSIAMLSHVPCEWTQMLCLVTCAYTSHITRNLFNIHINSWVLYWIKTKKSNNKTKTFPLDKKSPHCMKHIKVKYHFIKTHIAQNIFKIVYTPSSQMTADIFTTFLPPS